MDRVPDELLQLGNEDFTNLRLAVAAIRNQIKEWRIRDSNFGPIGGLPHPVAIIRSCLAKCKDDAASPDTAGLEFIKDEDLRESIRRDISGAHRDLGQGEWKEATVLAGSAVEALLLWALQKHEAEKHGALAATVDALVAEKLMVRRRDIDPETWELQHYIPVASRLRLIGRDTATQASLARNYRNLIHPARAARLGQVCNRATALGALAAAEAVAEDLSRGTV